jgi:hypothetical protein
MGKVFAVVVALSVAAPAFAQIKSAKEQRQDFQRASGVCQASVNDQREGLQGPGRRGRDSEPGRDRPGPVGAPDSRPTHAHAGRPGPAKREPRDRRAVGDQGVRHPRTDRATAAADPQRTTRAARAIQVMGGVAARGSDTPVRWPIIASGDIGKETE